MARYLKTKNFYVRMATDRRRKRKVAMARQVMITDDLDGSTNAEEVIFGWDGINWSIDLSEDNKAKLQEALQPYLDVAHPTRIAGGELDEEEPRRRSRRARGEAAAGPKVDYATLEHAGTPHRGRTTEAEAQLVRDHLDEINERLKADGHPTIDPTDEKAKRRYGF